MVGIFVDQGVNQDVRLRPAISYLGLVNRDQLQALLQANYTSGGLNFAFNCFASYQRGEHNDVELTNVHFKNSVLPSPDLKLFSNSPQQKIF